MPTKIGGRPRIQSPTAVPRVHESVEPHARQYALFRASNRAQHRGQRSHGDVVGLELVGANRHAELLSRQPAKAASHHTLQQSAMR